MNELQTWWDKFLVDASNFFVEAWTTWVALPSDHRLVIGFSAIFLCFCLLVFVYKRRLRKARIAIANLEAGNLLARQCIHDMSHPFQVAPEYDDEDEEELGQTIEVDGGLQEEFVLETFGRFQSMHNETLEVLKSLATDNSSRIDACTRAMANSLGEQFTEVLEKVAQQQSNSNKVLLDTVDHITTLHQATHEQTMETMQRLVKCVEHVLEEPMDDDDEDDEE